MSSTGGAAQLQAQMVALVRAFGLLDGEHTPCGEPLSVSSAHALMELAAGSPLTQAELGSRLRLEKSTVSRLVGNLEQRAWVARRRDPHDGRAQRLSLTAEGHALAARVAAARARRFAAIAAHLPAAKQEAVVHALRTLVDAIDATESPVSEGRLASPASLPEEHWLIQAAAGQKARSQRRPATSGVAK